MRVHASSQWETIETSLRVAARRKRSRQSKGGGENASDTESLALAVRFISQRRASSSQKAKKMRKTGAVTNPIQQEYLVPSVVLTGEHRISVVGNGVRDGSLRESEFLQYSSRPGRASSFLVCENESYLGDIPAIYDAKHETVYAFQKGNMKLMCWPAESGPDQSKSIALQDSPAVDLALNRHPTTGKVLLYGSCQNGKVFLVETATDSSLHLQYVESKKEDASFGTGHVVSTFVRRLGKESLHTAAVGIKRNIHSTTADSEGRLMVYQVAVESEKNGITFFSHDITLGQTTSGRIQPSIHGSKVVSSSLIPLTTSESSRPTLDGLRVAGICEKINAVVLSYEVSMLHQGKENGERSVHQQHFVSLLSIDSGILMSPPTELPLDSMHVGLVGSKVLAVGTKDSVVLIDLVRGGCLYRQPLPDQSNGTGYLMVTDEAKSRLAIVYTSKTSDKVFIAVPSGVFQARLKALTQGTLSLAKGLVASLSQQGVELTADQFLCQENAFSSSAFSTESSDPSLTFTTKQSVVSMVRAYHMILESSPVVSKSPSFLMDAYDSTLKFIGGMTTLNHDDSSTQADDNPQDAVPSKRSKYMNGAHSLHRTKLKLMNGSVNQLSGRTIVDCDAPHALVSCAATIAVRLLFNHKVDIPSTVKRDSSLLLCRLLKTEKVLARTHLLPDITNIKSFASLLRTLDMVHEEHANQAYSPLNFVVDMFKYCPDVSEGQMVASIKFVLSWADPDDFAALLKDHSNTKLSDCGFQFLAMRKSEANGKSSEVKTLSSKIIKHGALLVMDHILSYSSCNDGLLRTALSDFLSVQEMITLVGLLQVKFSLRSVQWLSAISDCLPAEPSVSYAADVQRLRKRIAREISKTETMLSLRAALVDRPRVETSNDKSDTSNQSAHLPPYQLERLLF